MKFYITAENTFKLKKAFLNLKLYSIISVTDILNEYGYTYDGLHDYGAFIVNQKIVSLINTYIKSKRIRGIIYSNEHLSKCVIDNIFDMLDPVKRIQDIEHTRIIENLEE